MKFSMVLHVTGENVPYKQKHTRIHYVLIFNSIHIWGKCTHTMLLLICCLLLLLLWEYVIVLRFVVRYFMPILVLQSSEERAVAVLS